MNNNNCKINDCWTNCLTSICHNQVYNMLLVSQLQSFQKLVALVLCRQQVQYGFTSSIRCSYLTAYIIILSARQDLG